MCYLYQKCNKKGVTDFVSEIKLVENYNMVYLYRSRVNGGKQPYIVLFIKKAKNY